MCFIKSTTVASVFWGVTRRLLRRYKILIMFQKSCIMLHNPVFRGLESDYTGPYKFIVYVPCGKLSRGDTFLRNVEFYKNSLLFFYNLGILERLAIADADFASKAFSVFESEVGTYIVDFVVVDKKRFSEKSWMVVAHTNVDNVAFNIGGKHVDRFFVTSNVETLALTNGIVLRSNVLGNDKSVVGSVNIWTCECFEVVGIVVTVAINKSIVGYLYDVTLL